MLLAVQGHPQLIEIASRAAALPAALRQQLDEADRAWAENRTPLTSFLLDADSTAAGVCLQAIESWTTAVRSALPEDAAMLFDILCAVEETDCGDFGGRIAWGQVRERLGLQGDPASFDEMLGVLQQAALVEVPPSDEGRFRVFRLHPAVAAAGRAAAAADLLAAVDSEMALFLHSGFAHTLKIESGRHGTMVRIFGQHAVPYLLRAGRLGDASDVLIALLLRDQSPEAVQEILPLLRRVAAGAAGTSYELPQRAYAARAESFVHPAAAEAELRDLLRQAEDSERFGLALGIAGDLVRVTRDTGRLDEAAAFADKATTLARASQAGPWAELGAEITRLQIQLQRGEAEAVLRRSVWPHLRSGISARARPSRPRSQRDSPRSPAPNDHAGRAPRPEPARASSTSPETMSRHPRREPHRGRGKIRMTRRQPANSADPWSAPRSARRAPIGRLRNPPTVACPYKLFRPEMSDTGLWGMQLTGAGIGAASRRFARAGAQQAVPGLAGDRHRAVAAACSGASWRRGCRRSEPGRARPRV